MQVKLLNSNQRSDPTNLSLWKDKALKMTSKHGKHCLKSLSEFLCFTLHGGISPFSVFWTIRNTHETDRLEAANQGANPKRRPWQDKENKGTEHTERDLPLGSPKAPRISLNQGWAQAGKRQPFLFLPVNLGGTMLKS